MSNDAYDTVLNQVQLLPPDEQFRLLEDLVVMLRQRNARKPQHSILEFEGLGKEMWEGVNVEDYINEERDSWASSNEKAATTVDEMLSILRKSSREQTILADMYDKMDKIYDKMDKILAKDTKLKHQNQEPQTGKVLKEYIRQEKDS